MSDSSKVYLSHNQHNTSLILKINIFVVSLVEVNILFIVRIWIQKTGQQIVERRCLRKMLWWMVTVHYNLEMMINRQWWSHSNRVAGQDHLYHLYHLHDLYSPHSTSKTQICCWINIFGGIRRFIKQESNYHSHVLAI